jgi:hypothetical protein
VNYPSPLYAPLIRGLRCIRGFAPKVCPFCRKSFTIGRKLHIDVVEGAKSASTVVSAYSNVLLERIALVFDEAATTEDVCVIVTEVNNWISARSDWDDPNSVSRY